MVRPSRAVAYGCALLACSAAPIAGAQGRCVEREDLSDTAVYAMPHLYQGFVARCSERLAPNGFVAREGDRWIASFEAEAEAAWPGARRLIAAFAGDKGGLGSVGEMPDEAIRPFVDALIPQAIADEIELESCGELERGLELVASLPARNLADLVPFIASLAGVEDPELCPIDE